MDIIEATNMLIAGRMVRRELWGDDMFLKCEDDLRLWQRNWTKDRSVHMGDYSHPFKFDAEDVRATDWVEHFLQKTERK